MLLKGSQPGMLMPVMVDMDCPTENRLMKVEITRSQLDRLSKLIENYPDAVVLFLRRCTRVSKTGPRVPCREKDTCPVHPTAVRTPTLIGMA